MRGVLSIGITALLLWALVPGTGELLENAVHLVAEGHLAHATPDGDHHHAPGPEHGCTGTLHLCSCCVSPSFAPARSPAPFQRPESLRLVTVAAARPTATASGSVYHPPRA